MNRHLILTFAYSWFTITMFGQLTHIPLSNTFTDQIAPALSFTAHSTIQPYNPFEHRILVDSLQRTLDINNNFTKTWLGRKLLNENLANVQHLIIQFI
ncbi:MAG: hypothetical protein HC892_02040 [Saprospiraceae bacterium]|nr:hypothetical protein [Saprospiraceae bacterium]